MMHRRKSLRTVLFGLALLICAGQARAAGILDFDPVKVNSLKKEGLSASWVVRRLAKYPQEKDWLDFLSRYLASPVAQAAAFRFDPKTPLEKRVRPPPAFVLEQLKKIDNTTAYAAHAPTAKQAQTVARLLAAFPPQWVSVFRQRYLGVYFVKGLKSSGYTDWVVDEQGRVFAWTALRAEVLDLSAQELLNKKEATVFKADKSGVSVSVSLGGGATGLDYILTHEATHVADMLLGLTPWTEEVFTLFRVKAGRTDFTAPLWRDYNLPHRMNNFPGREKITFYGFGDGPLIPLAEARALYGRFSKQPFVSLYGSLNWAEELAELMAFDAITQRGRQRYVLTVKQPGQTDWIVEPMKNPKVLIRLKKAKGLGKF